MAKKYILDKAKFLLTIRGIVIDCAVQGGKPFRVKLPKVEKVHLRRIVEGYFYPHAYGNQTLVNAGSGVSHIAYFLSSEIRIFRQNQEQ